MDNDFDEFDEEVEDFEKEDKVKKPSKKKEVVKETEEPLDRYAAFYQEPRMGIIDTLTKEVVVDGLTDYGITQLEAIKLNKLDKIGIASGVQ